MDHARPPTRRPESAENLSGFPLFCSCNMHDSYDEPREPVISTDDEEAIAPEEERRDPEDECATTPIQGVLTAVPVPRTASRGQRLKNVSSKLTVGPSPPLTEFSFYALGRWQRIACTGWVEHLVSASQRMHSRDLSTPPPSPALRDPSESVEMTALRGNRKHNLSGCPRLAGTSIGTPALKAGGRCQLSACERSLSNSGEYEILENH